MFEKNKTILLFENHQNYQNFIIPFICLISHVNSFEASECDYEDERYPKSICLVVCFIVGQQWPPFHLFYIINIRFNSKSEQILAKSQGG